MNGIRYFKEREFSCKCCGYNNIKYKLVFMIDKVRIKLQVPLIINSGCRCKKYNKIHKQYKKKH